MGITLNRKTAPVRVTLVGECDLEMLEGRMIKLRTYGVGPEEVILDDECPAGKKWEVHVQIAIKETDA